MKLKYAAVVSVASALSGLCGCDSRPSYVSSATPLDIGGHKLLCVSIARNDPPPVRWWEPGRLGCKTRSTGPSVFVARDATVNSGAGSVTARFRLSLHDGGFRQVTLILKDGVMRSQESGDGVQTVETPRLDVPEGY